MQLVRITIYLIISSILPASYAQKIDTTKVLAVEHKRKFKRAIFAPGQLIRFQMKDDKAMYRGMLTEVTDSSFFILRAQKVENLLDASQRVSRDEIHFRFLSTIYTRANERSKGWDFFRKMMGDGMVRGGLAYSVFLPIDAWIGGSTPDPTNLRIGWSMLATGLLVKLLPRRRRYKIGKSHRLRVL